VPDILTAQKLGEGVRRCDERMSWFRAQGAENVRKIVGRHYSEETASEPESPLNLLGIGAKVMLSRLAGRAPAHDVSVRGDFSLRGRARAAGMVIRQLDEELDRAAIMREVTFDALVRRIGIVKIGVREGQDLVTISGRVYDPGKTYIKRIDPDDWVFDTTATSRSAWAWEGHRYRVCRSVAIESGLFNPDLIVDVPSVTETARMLPDRETEWLSMPRLDDEDAWLSAHIELLDICLYNDDVSYIVTLPSHPSWAHDYLRITEYEGPERGPYEHLVFDSIPNNAIPNCWANDARDASDAARRVVTKHVEAVENRKDINLHKKGVVSEKEMKRMASAKHGAHLAVTDPGATKRVSSAGTLPDIVPTIALLGEFFNKSANNPDLLSGTDADGGTATKYAGQSGHAERLIGAMESIKEAFDARVTKRLMWWEVTNPLPNAQRQVTVRLPGGQEFQTKFDPTTKDGDAIDFQFRIRPRSNEQLDPHVRTARVLEAVGQVASLAEMAMVTQGLIDPVAGARVIAAETGFDELTEIVRDPQMLMEQIGAMQQVTPPMQPGMPQPVPGMQNPGYGLQPVPSGPGVPGTAQPGPAMYGAGGAFGGAMRGPGRMRSALGRRPAQSPVGAATRPFQATAAPSPRRAV
jgi:hypothetical protein